MCPNGSEGSGTLASSQLGGGPASYVPRGDENRMTPHRSARFPAPANAHIVFEALGNVVAMEIYVQQLWRYPVKSMAGESLEVADIHDDGIAGDRLVVVHGPRGLVTSRTRP